MPLLIGLVGQAFYLLLQHGREIELLLKRDELHTQAQSTRDLEQVLGEKIIALPRRNGFSVAGAMMLLLMAFALNLLTLLAYIPTVSPPVHALSFFVPSLMMLIVIIGGARQVVRGFSSGISGGFYLFIILLAATVGQLVCHYVFLSSPVWPLWAAFAALAGCRILFNCQHFTLSVLYCRMQRCARHAYCRHK